MDLLKSPSNGMLSDKPLPITLKHDGIQQFSPHQLVGAVARIFFSDLDADKVEFGSAHCRITQEQSFATPNFEH